MNIIDAMETSLAFVAAERVRDGSLPWTEVRTFGGCGSGAACALCGSAIPMSEMELEVEYGTNSGMKTLVMHVECNAVWRGAIREANLRASESDHYPASASIG